MRKKVVIYMGIMVLAVMAVFIAAAKQKGYGYSEECGIYKVISTYEDIPEEDRCNYSKDYEFRIVNLDLRSVIRYWKEP